jgi:uncharacterized membrane protein YraQ (UPF0718 family)
MDTIHSISRFWIIPLVISGLFELRSMYLAKKFKSLYHINFGKDIFGSISISWLKALLVSVPTDDLRMIIEKLMTAKRAFYFFLIVALIMLLLPYFFKYLIS